MITRASFILKSNDNHNKIFVLSELKAFADNKINETRKLESALGRVENIVGKRRKCWLPAFSPLPHNVFERLLYQAC